MRKTKVTHIEARDFNVRLGLETCISRVENPTGTLSSSLCQMLNKETVGLIPVIGVWLLTLELDSTSRAPSALDLAQTLILIINQPSVADHHDQ